MFYLLVFDPFNPDRSVEYWGYSDMNSILDIIRDLVFVYNLRDDIDRIYEHIHIFKARYGKKLKRLSLPPANIIQYNMIHKQFSHDEHDSYVEQFKDLENPEENTRMCYSCDIVYRKRKVCKHCDGYTDLIIE